MDVAKPPAAPLAALAEGYCPHCGGRLTAFTLSNARPNQPARYICPQERLMWTYDADGVTTGDGHSFVSVRAYGSGHGATVAMIEDATDPRAVIGQLVREAKQ